MPLTQLPGVGETVGDGDGVGGTVGVGLGPEVVKTTSFENPLSVPTLLNAMAAK